MVRVIGWVWLFANLVIVQPWYARAAAGDPRLTIDDVWLYLPMEGSPQAAVGDHVLETRYRQWTADAVTDDPAPPLRFSDGLAGQALDVGEPSGDRPGDALAYLLDLRTFPADAGSVVLWYKPARALAEETVWLYGMGWVRFQAQISGNRLGVHATAENKHAIYSSLKPLAVAWRDTWHLVVTTWDKSTVRVFVDGQMIGERLDVKPLGAAPSPRLDIGSLPPGGARTTPVAYAHGLLDDIVLLSRPLGSTQVMDLWRAGRAPGFEGFLGMLPTGALVKMRRHAYLRGEEAEAVVTPFAAGGEGWLVATDSTRRIELGRVASHGVSAITIDTVRLRPGAYTLAVELPDAQGRIAVSGRCPLVIRGHRQPEFPVGLGGEFGSSEETLALYEKLHLSHLSSNGPQGDMHFWKQLDRAFAHGLCLFPNFNILGVWSGQYESLKQEPYFRKDESGAWRVNPEWGWKYLQTLVFADGSPDDHRSTSSASPFSPIAWGMMTNRVGQIMRRAGDHPGLWAVSFQDEVPFRMHTDEDSGKLKVGDYSYYAVEYFKQKSGRKGAAFPPDDPEGTVWPDDHPYLQWIRHIGLPGNDFTTVGFEDLYCRLAQEVKRYRPDVLAGNYSGGEYGRNDFVLDWNYPVIWAPEPWSSGRGAGYLDFVFDRHWARQHARPRKPLWALLGWWSGDMSGQPDWCVADLRLNTELALAKGVKQLMWFAAGHGPLSEEKSGPFSHPALRTELEKWCAFVHAKGPMFARLEKRPGRRIAVLWSKTNRAGHVFKTSDKAEPFLVFAGLRNIGAGPDVVTDTMIREGVLGDYDALVLCGFNYSSDDLWGKLKDFAAAPGKVVFHDTTSTLVPSGSISLDAAWTDTFGAGGDGKHGALRRTEAVGKWANHLRDIVLPRLPDPEFTISDSSGQVGAHLLWAGETPYLFVINTDLERARRATVRFPHSGPVAYDLVTGKGTSLEPVDGWVELAARLEPGGWSACLLPPARVTGVGINAACDEGRLNIGFSILAGAERPVASAWPMRVELLDPAGIPTSYTWQTSTSADGRGALAAGLGRLTDPAGRWTARVTDELTGESAAASFPVAWPAPENGRRLQEGAGR